MLKSRLPFTGSNALNGPRVPRFQRDVEVLLNLEFPAFSNDEISDEHTRRKAKKHLHDIVVGRPI